MDFVLIGLGVVGSAVLNSCIRECTVYDESTELFTDETIINTSTDIVMICVDTPMEISGKQNPSALRKILDALYDQEYNGIVIIKSTILYNNIKDYINKLNIVMSPEFLNQRTSNQDFYEQDYFVLGGNILHTKIVEFFYKKYFKFEYGELKFEHVSIKEAIDFKYTRNILCANKVLFWEMVQDLTGNASKMAEMLKNIPVKELSNVSQDGYRGYGQSLQRDSKDFSACLDKDICAVNNNTQHVLLQAMNDYNESL